MEDNNHTIIPRHSRESGNPEAAVRNIGPFLLRKRRNRFPLSRELPRQGADVPNSVAHCHTPTAGWETSQNVGNANLPQAKRVMQRSRPRLRGHGGNRHLPRVYRASRSRIGLFETAAEPPQPILAPGTASRRRATTDPARFEENAESVELWSPGNPSFQEHAVQLAGPAFLARQVFVFFVGVIRGMSV